eukprot:SAG11_NODE_8588_length_998_cov_1.487208_3_plen_60_part_01
MQHRRQYIIAPKTSKNHIALATVCVRAARAERDCVRGVWRGQDLHRRPWRAIRQHPLTPP